MDTKQIMDIKDLAEYMGLSRSKIYQLIKEKKIPASKIGRQYKFSKDLIDAWLRENVITSRMDQLDLFKKAKKGGENNGEEKSSEKSSEKGVQEEKKMNT